MPQAGSKIVSPRSGSTISTMKARICRGVRNWPFERRLAEVGEQVLEDVALHVGAELLNSMPSSSSMTCLSTLGSTISSTASRKYSATCGSSFTSDAM